MFIWVYVGFFKVNWWGGGGERGFGKIEIMIGINLFYLYVLLY